MIRRQLLKVLAGLPFVGKLIAKPGPPKDDSLCACIRRLLDTVQTREAVALKECHWICGMAFKAEFFAEGVTRRIEWIREEDKEHLWKKYRGFTIAGIPAGASPDLDDQHLSNMAILMHAEDKLGCVVAKVFGDYDNVATTAPTHSWCYWPPSWRDAIRTS